VAEEFQAKGFTNAKALLGGVEAWKKAGYGLIAAKQPA
jgi:rhodanese-related sulfurtransferase